MKKYSIITTRYLKEHKKRTILTICGIIVAIAMFTAVALIYYSLLGGTIERVKRDVGDFEVGFIKLSKENVEVLKKNSEIESGAATNKLGKLIITNEQLSDKTRSLEITAYSAEAFTQVFEPEIVEGRLPEDSSELIVDARFYPMLKAKNQNQAIVGQIEQEGENIKQSYKVVGSYSTNAVISGMCYPAITYLDETPVPGNNYFYFATLKDKKQKSEVAQQIAKDTGTEVVFNKELLYLYKQGPDRNKNRQLEIMVLTVICIIVLSVVVVIYNSFNASIIERIKHFGILRAIGATKDQIRKLVLKEALIMSLIALPLGIISGYIGIYITFQIVKGFSEWFKFGFYPQVIVIGAVLGIGTVLLSVLMPSVSASRVSPIEAIRGNGVIKKEKVKYRKGFFAKLIFKFEGQVAYRNMRRNGRRFWLTTFSLVISLIIFVFFNNLVSTVIQSMNMMYRNSELEGYFQIQAKVQTETLGIDFIKELQELEGISKVYANNLYRGPLLIQEEKLNRDYYNDLRDWSKDKVRLYKEMYICEAGALLDYDENSFNYAKQKYNLSMNYLELEDNGVILINKSSNYNQKGEGILGDFTKYKVGDQIQIPKMSKGYFETGEMKYVQEAIDKKEFITLKVVGIVEKEALLDEHLKFFGMIVSHENFNRITGTLGYNLINIKYSSREDSEKLYEKLSALGDNYGAEFFDAYKYMEQNKRIMLQIMTLGYGFIALITLIAIINIINTITMNLLVKKREFAVFKAIGMTKRQFQKLVLLEGTLYGIFASIIGGVASYVLVNVILDNNNPIIAEGINLPIWPYSVGMLGIISITFIAALLPLRKLNDMNIIEGLRIEE